MVVDNGAILLPDALMMNSGASEEARALVRAAVLRVQPVEARDELLKMLDV